MNVLIEKMKEKEKEVQKIMDLMWIDSKNKKGDKNDT